MHTDKNRFWQIRIVHTDKKKVNSVRKLVINLVKNNSP